MSDNYQYKIVFKDDIARIYLVFRVKHSTPEVFNIYNHAKLGHIFPAIPNFQV